MEYSDLIHKYFQNQQANAFNLTFDKKLKDTLDSSKGYEVIVHNPYTRKSKWCKNELEADAIAETENETMKALVESFEIVGNEKKIDSTIWNINIKYQEKIYTLVVKLWGGFSPVWEVEDSPEIDRAVLNYFTRDIRAIIQDRENNFEKSPTHSPGQVKTRLTERQLELLSRRSGKEEGYHSDIYWGDNRALHGYWFFFNEEIFRIVESSPSSAIIRLTRLLKLDYNQIAQKINSNNNYPIYCKWELSDGSIVEYNRAKELEYQNSLSG